MDIISLKQTRTSNISDMSLVDECYSKFLKTGPIQCIRFWKWQISLELTMTLCKADKADIQYPVMSKSLGKLPAAVFATLEMWLMNEKRKLDPACSLHGDQFFASLDDNIVQPNVYPFVIS